MNIREIREDDIVWLKAVFASTNNQANPETLLGFIAEEEGRKVGLITYTIEEAECEIMSINSLTPGKGIGGALYEKVQQEAKQHNCKKLIVTTDEFTKDFFLSRGFTFEGNGTDLGKSL